MTDSWSKRSTSNKTVTFKIEGDKKSGFVYSAKMDGRNIMDRFTGSLEVLTRKEVENMFADYVE